MPAHDDGAACTEGRRSKTSKGGNRGNGYAGEAAGAMGILLSQLMMATAAEAIRPVGLRRCGA
jgi:hypothetical protein